MILLIGKCGEVVSVMICEIVVYQIVIILFTDGIHDQVAFYPGSIHASYSEHAGIFGDFLNRGIDFTIYSQFFMIVWPGITSGVYNSNDFIVE